MPSPSLTLPHPTNYALAGEYWPRAYWARHSYFYWPLAGPRPRSVTGDTEVRVTATGDSEVRLTAAGDTEIRITATGDSEIT